MPAHERRRDRAVRIAQASLSELGRELRTARQEHDLSQSDVARALGVSYSTVGRIERGQLPRVALQDLAVALSTVGLDLSVRAYPGGSPLRDTAHSRLLERLRQRLGPDVAWSTEVPLPRAGERRAWDAVIRVGVIRIGVEAETRTRDAQALERRLASKLQDGGVDRLILLLADTRHHRSFRRTMGKGFAERFPVSGVEALRALERGQDPGGSALILL